jgi:hypothetical protein
MEIPKSNIAQANGMIKSKILSSDCAKVKVGILVIGNHAGTIPASNITLMSPDQYAPYSNGSICHIFSRLTPKNSKSP